MYSLQTLDIQGYRQETVPNTFFQQDKPTDHAAIILPGKGYGCLGPVLHYPSLALLERGADVLCVDYTQRPNFSTLSTSELRQCSTADAEAAFQALMSQRDYQRMTIVGKSLGTMVMGHLLTTLPISIPIQTVWLTPLLHFQELREQMKQVAGPSFIVIGTADPQYDPTLLEEVQKAANAAVLIIENANHSLEFATNVLESIEAMEDITEAFQTFLKL
jgi:pimeloyl-ACP methyl ester carboxylesterase